jgi:competence protein ComEC
MLAGAYALGLCRQLPPDAAFIPAIVVMAACLGTRWLRLAGFAMFGLVMAWFAARGMLNDRLPHELQGEAMPVTVRVADFPEASSGSVRFIAEAVDDFSLGRRFRLSWYDTDQRPRLGETWRLEVRLRRPRGLANPTGFDYELWLARQRIGATGYVVAGPGNARLEAFPIDGRSALRQRLVERMVGVTGEGHASAVLLAITVGARHLIGAEQWERYAISGTSHLMAISGLHIGLAAVGAWLLGRITFPVFCRSANIRDLAAVAAVAAAWAYAEISGFAIPARRAMLMTVLVMATFLLRRPVSAGRIFAASCIAVFVGDPLAIHAPGFKLSFGAVAILLWVARQRYCRSERAPCGAKRIVGGAVRLSALQLTLLFGLLPLTVLIFGRMSWMAPAVNLLVLPVFNLVTVPAALLGLLLDGPLALAGDFLLRAAWHSVRLMLWLVDTVAGWPPANLQVAAPTGIMLAVVLLSALRALVPPGFPGRALAYLAAASALSHSPPAPPAGCVDLVALDVGQGLSVALRTSRRTLVFDTGPSFRGGSDLGRFVLVPWLRTVGISKVDMLVVSHSDDDHSGGAGSLVDAVNVAQILAGERLADVKRPQLRCRSGQAWLWDGIRFSVLHPGLYPLQSDNNASCVVEVATGARRILLTGDIESAVENHLVRTGALERVDVVVVPHHGSRTSSGRAFVKALEPAVAIVSAGHGNRWGFPKEEVVTRWREAGAQVMNTATSGAIHYRACADGELRLLGEHRKRMQRYWHDRTAD